MAGEETALVAFVDGKPAKPTAVPPRPFERGVGGRPTLVQNVETFADVALIARYGPAWFREKVGTHDEPGSMLLTVSGGVRAPRRVRGRDRHTARRCAGRRGGPTHELSAVLVGGYYGTWLPADAFDVPLSNTAVRAAAQRSDGAGVVHAFPAGRCGVRASARILVYLAGESAGSADRAPTAARGRRHHGTRRGRTAPA